MYENLSGMTGTAKTEEEELIQIYNLEVIEIPTNLPIQRADNQDVVYKTKKAKLEAVINDIKERNEKGQPVLLGTVSVESSEEISKSLTNNGIKHSVLNAKNHEQEASIIAQAGKLKAVTVATNMAGRGVDIKLGGNSEEMTLLEAKNEDKLDDIDFVNKKRQENEKKTIEEKEQVLKCGGLYVIGTERHESRRIDNQLRGRSGRQGDPGESRFFISLEDDLMRRFQGERIQSIMDKLNLPDDERIEQNMVTKSIERAQAQVESLNFEIRKNVLKFDQVLNQQREVIYKWRKRLLSIESNKDLLKEWKNDVLDILGENYEQLKMSFDTVDGFNEGVSDLLSEILSDRNRTKFIQSNEISPKSNIDLINALEELFVSKEKKEDTFWEVGRMASLSYVDQAWREHLAEMDHIRSGIGLRAMGQRDPLVEYQKEGYDLFEELISRVKFSVIRLLYNFEKEVLVKSEKSTEEKDKGGSVGRNDQCPCGSGKKYKRCHG